ncbi:M20/M25/M40 family metallo-hydrolase [Allosphingosinicella indica]|uniref:Acetylornithine deacetylase/Succinyl-diaminopimelate desuccinylase n=1 Tax=Allosphingosinicella indica TaxID=941907 RepID=A0A1X7G2G1_9SPHN|nr:M20/M25/M40 family metallo-hydrolase [Allosphingosinicella indica]SMF62782.1 Acetylornithine deacetylase/Succinyl-diaminopimelate desuccinylase [Allosphingosinicella indica]
MRHLALAAALALLPAASQAAAPGQWHQTARDIYKQAIEIPTVEGRKGTNAALAEALKARFVAAGITDATVRPYADTAALVVRWPAAGKASAKPIMLMAHMDVVEALPADWSVTDPFKLVEKDGYFYGRGTSDDKQGVVAVTTALLQLKAEGFRPTRDIIVLFTGDEETAGEGARLAANEWPEFKGLEYGLNADGGGGGFRKDGSPLGFGLQTAEKTYVSYSFTTRNPGGHSSQPRPDNAIYQLADALKRLETHRFQPALNETTRAYFTERAKQEKGPLGDAMRRWLADEKDGAAADAIEASEEEVGRTRTRCVATRLAGGHADNALPQTARATVNCRILPGVDPSVIEAELKALAGPLVEVATSDPGTPTPASPLRPDVVRAYTAAVHARHPGSPIIPQMSTGATDGLFFRAVGVPVYGVDGAWGVVPDDDRAHGKDERLAVKALYDNVDHWHAMISALAGK